MLFKLSLRYCWCELDLCWLHNLTAVISCSSDCRLCICSKALCICFFFFFFFLLNHHWTCEIQYFKYLLVHNILVTSNTGCIQVISHLTRPNVYCYTSPKNSAGWDAGFKQIHEYSASQSDLEKRYSVRTASTLTPQICSLPPISDNISQLAVLCFIPTQLFIMKSERGGNLVILDEILANWSRWQNSHSYPQGQDFIHFLHIHSYKCVCVHLHIFREGLFISRYYYK